MLKWQEHFSALAFDGWLRQFLLPLLNVLVPTVCINGQLGADGKAEGISYADPPRHGGRGGAPMDGFTASRAEQCALPDFSSNINKKM